MAGPKQASICCLGLGLLPVVGPWLSSAALALVILQVGFPQAMKVLPWAALPAIVWSVTGDMAYLVLLCSVVLGAVALQTSRRLSQALVVAVFVSALGFLFMQAVKPDALDQLIELMNEALSRSAGNNVELDAQSLKAREGSIALLTHMAFAWAGALTACLVLLLGRWWQSLLYKPGAFQQEFHALRLNWNQLLLSGLAMVVSVQAVGSLGFGNALLAEGQMGLALAPVFSLPLMLSSVALVHGLVAIAGASVHWLGVFYLLLLFVGHFVYMPLIVVAVLDVMFDFRVRFRASRTNGSGE